MYIDDILWRVFAILTLPVRLYFDAIMKRRRYKQMQTYHYGTAVRHISQFTPPDTKTRDRISVDIYGISTDILRRVLHIFNGTGSCMDIDCAKMAERIFCGEFYTYFNGGPGHVCYRPEAHVRQSAAVRQ